MNGSGQVSEVDRLLLLTLEGQMRLRQFRIKQIYERIQDHFGCSAVLGSQKFDMESASGS